MNIGRWAVQKAKQALLPQQRAFRRVVFGPAAGCSIMLDLNHELRLYLGIYERELWSSYKALLTRGMNSFDIGGRDGYSALLIAKHTAAQVLSFECEPTGLALMQATFERNELPVRAIQAFVGSRANPLTTMTVDEAAQNFFRPDFIKIDVEGGEADVLMGASALLADNPPKMIVEVHGSAAERDCLEHLERFAYDVKIVDRSTLFPEKWPLEHNRWLVCVPVRT